MDVSIWLFRTSPDVSSSVCNASRAGSGANSDHHAYAKEMIKPDEMQDVEILGRCRVRIGRIL